MYASIVPVGYTVFDVASFTTFTSNSPRSSKHPQSVPATAAHLTDTPVWTNFTPSITPL